MDNCVNNIQVKTYWLGKDVDDTTYIERESKKHIIPETAEKTIKKDMFDFYFHIGRILAIVVMISIIFVAHI